MKCAYWMPLTFQTPGDNFHWHDLLGLESEYSRDLRMPVCFMTETCNWDSAIECAARRLWEGNCACTATDILRSLLPITMQGATAQKHGSWKKRKEGFRETQRKRQGWGVRWGGSVHGVLCQHALLCQARLLSQAIHNRDWHDAIFCGKAFSNTAFMWKSARQI